MAEEEQKILIDVEYSSIEEYSKAAADAKKNVDALTASNKELKASGTATDEQIESSNSALRTAQKEYKNAKGTLDKMAAANKATGTSYDSLYAQWVAAERELKSLDGTIVKNADGTYTLSESYKKASKEVAAAKDALNKFTTGVNDGRNNVGLYTQGITDAMKQTSLFGNAFNVIGDVKGKFSGAVTGVKNLSSSFSTLKAAIASTGIGLLVIALGALVTWFQKSAEGGGIMKQAMAAVGEVFNTLIGTLTKVGKLLKDVFTGDWGKLRADTQAIGDEWKNIGSNMREAADLAKLEISLAKEKRKTVVDEASITRDIAKLRLDAADKTKTNKERIDALRKSLSLEKDLTGEKVGLAEKELNILQRRIKLQESHGVKASKDDKDRLAELTAAKINAESEEYQRSRRAVSQISAMQKEAQEAAFQDKKIKLQAEEILAEGNYEKLRKNLIDNYNLDIRQSEITGNKKLLLKVTLDKALRDLDKKQFEDKEKLDKNEAEFNKQLGDDLLASEKELGDKLREQQKNDSNDRFNTRKIEAANTVDLLNSQLSTEITAQTTNSQQLIDARIEENKMLQDILDEEFANWKESEEYKNSSQAQRALMEAQYAQGSIALSNQMRDIQIQNDDLVLQNRQKALDTTADIFGTMADLMGKQTKLGKSFAITQALINTYSSATAAYNSAASIPVVGWVLGPIAAAAAVAMGLKNVAAIKSANVGGGGGGAASGGSGQTLSSTFTAASPRVATSQAAASQSGAIGVAQQGDAQAAKAGNATAQALQNNPPVLYVDTFEAKQNEKNAVSVKANV